MQTSTISLPGRHLPHSNDGGVHEVTQGAKCAYSPSDRAEETLSSAYPFFDQKVRALLDAGFPDAAAQLISAASIDKEFGYGPPLDDLNRARRMWLDAFRATS